MVFYRYLRPDSWEIPACQLMFISHFYFSANLAIFIVIFRASFTCDEQYDTVYREVPEVVLHRDCPPQTIRPSMRDLTSRQLALPRVMLRCTIDLNLSCAM